jgi:hypothetical protein
MYLPSASLACQCPKTRRRYVPLSDSTVLPMPVRQQPRPRVEQLPRTLALPERGTGSGPTRRLVPLGQVLVGVELRVLGVGGERQAHQRGRTVAASVRRGAVAAPLVGAAG